MKARATLFLLSFALYCPKAWSQCSLNIQADIISGWNKAGVSYTVEKNTLKIKVGEGIKDDSDSIYIGSLTGCSTLTVEVSKISGRYPWGGKAIGFSFANDALEPRQWGNQASFPAPIERTIEDGFIKANLSNNEKIVYEIDNSAKTTYIGAKVFIGSNDALELQFSAQPALSEPQISAQKASRDRQFSMRQPARSSRPYTSDTGYQSDSAAVSCSSNCHERRTERSHYAFTITPRASCRDRRD